MGHGISNNVELFYFLHLGIAIVLLLVLSFKNKFNNRFD